MDGIVLLENVKENRADWLKLRQKTIGSSEIVAVCGLSKYKSRLDLWAEKTGRTEPDQENEFMRLGTHMEPFIGGLFGRVTGMIVEPSNTLYRHKDVEWATASPDFFAYEPDMDGQRKIVECKNVNMRGADAWEDGNIPNAAHSQTIWQLGVTGLQDAYVAALVGASPNNFFTPKVTFSAELFQQMLDLAGSFMEMVQKDIPPAARADDVKLLDKLQPITEGESELPEQAESLIKQYLQLYATGTNLISDGEEHRAKADDIKAQLVQMMGGATKASIGSHWITQKRIHRAAYTSKPSSYIKVTIK